MGRRRLASIEARAHGHRGDTTAAQRALRIAIEDTADSRDALHDDVGGEFGFSPERTAMSTGSTCLLIGEGDQAERAARQALELVSGQPPQHRSVTIAGKASADLATARLQNGDLDGALEALEGLRDIPTEQRVTGLLVRADLVRRTLTSPRFRATSQARELQERIEDFARMSAQRQLGGTQLHHTASLEA